MRKYFLSPGTQVHTTLNWKQIAPDYTSTLLSLISFNGSIYGGTNSGELIRWDEVSSWQLVATTGFSFSLAWLFEHEGDLYASSNNKTDPYSMVKWDGSNSLNQVASQIEAGSFYARNPMSHNGDIYATKWDSDSATSDQGILIQWNGSGWDEKSTFMGQSQARDIFTIDGEIFAMGINGSFPPPTNYVVMRWNSLFEAWQQVSWNFSTRQPISRNNTGTCLLVGSKEISSITFFGIIPSAVSTLPGEVNENIVGSIEYESNIYVTTWDSDTSLGRFFSYDVSEDSWTIVESGLSPELDSIISRDKALYAKGSLWEYDFDPDPPSPSGSSNWDSTNWSLWPNGPIGYPPPGPDETAVFNPGAPGCLIDSTVDVGAWLTQPGYDQVIIQQSEEINIAGDAGFFGGQFYGEGANISIGGEMVISDCNFTSTDKTLAVEGDFRFEEDPNNNEFLYVEEYVLSAEDATNKYITLSYIPSDSSQVTLNILNGVSQRIGIDYNVDFMKLEWGGYTLEDDLAENDVLRVMYATEQTGFNHHNGTVILKSNDNLFRGSGIELWDLHVFQDNTGYLYVDKNSSVENFMYLEGYFKSGSDATIRIQGDLSCAQDFGIRGEGSNILLLMDGSQNQTVTVNNNSLLPSFGVDRDGPGQVVAWGVSPMQVDGNFELLDGTFNMNRLDVNVGVV